MTPSPPPPSSTIARVFAELGDRDPGWRHEIGRPEGAGWIAGGDMREARSGPLHDLLRRIGAELKTTDRRTIAASFALRFGWASQAAIGPILRAGCVPDVALDNVSFRFAPSGFFDRLALHEPRGTADAGDGALIRVLRDTLVAQSSPVVEALFAWAGFARRGTWGMLTSAWVSQFTSMAAPPDDQRTVLPVIDALFAGADVVALTRPRLQAVTCGSVTHLVQRRASCCRFYLLPQGGLCASCPLVSDAERLRRQREWMAAEAAARDGRGRHG